MYVATCVRMGIAPHAAVRNAALSSLQRFLTRSEGLPLGRALWAEALSGESGIVPLLEKLLGLVGRPAFPEGDKTLVLGLGAMSRAILQDVDVAQVWQQALTVLESCMSLDSAELAGEGQTMGNGQCRRGGGDGGGGGNGPCWLCIRISG